MTLPLIAPGIVAGFLLAFVLSLDDFVITNFVQGPTNTFPTWVYGASRLGVPPHVNVWGTVLFTIGILVAVANLITSGRSTRKRSAMGASPFRRRARREPRPLVKDFTSARANGL